MKESFPFTQKTKLLGLETFGSMQMEEQFEEIFDQIMNEKVEGEGEENKLSDFVVEKIASSVLLFTSEMGKENVAQNKFMEQVYKKCRQQNSMVFETIF